MSRESTLPGSETQRPAFWPEIRTLLLAAMVFFVFTIGIGILNGSDIVDFDRKRILGHVHSGTLGWLTLSVFAASLWLFGGETVVPRERKLIRSIVGYSISAFALYVTAFTTTYGGVRPLMGGLSVVVITVFFVWIISRAREITLGVPHLGFMAAVATSIIGGIIGVLWATELATGNKFLPTGGADAHPAVMVVGFLLPVALAMSEWSFDFPNPAPADRLGTIQMLFPFCGGVLLMVAMLFQVDRFARFAVLLELIGVVIFIVRMWPNLRRIQVFDPTPGRWAGASAVASVFVILLAQYFIIEYDADFDLVPEHQLLALDHAQFIASMSCAVFAMLVSATVGGLDPRTQDRSFWLVLAGVSVFVVGLLTDNFVLKRIGAPTMGVGLLIGLSMFARALVAMGSDGHRL